MTISSPPHGMFFPYFDSGNVIVSGMEQGLFVLKPTNFTPPTAVEVTEFGATGDSSEATIFMLLGAGLMGFIGVCVLRRR